MEEKWKIIDFYKGFENLYQVSQTGMVMNIKTGKILKPYKVKGGYLQVKLYNNYTFKNVSVHRLVAQAFVPNPDPVNFKEVNHKDQNKQNNNADNLEWCDRLYQVRYGDRSIRAGRTISEKMKGRKLSESHKQSISKARKGLLLYKKRKPVYQMDLNGNIIKEWSGMFEAEQQLGIYCSSIYYCCTGRYHTAGGYIWKFKD